MPLGLATVVMSLYASASFNKAVISVPSCCLLPEDMISGLAMQGKPVALSRGATTLGIRAALTVGHARLSTCYLDVSYSRI